MQIAKDVRVEEDLMNKYALQCVQKRSLACEDLEC